MLVRDLRPSGTPQTVSLLVRASEAAELLRLIGVLIDDDQQGYDVGAERIASLRAELKADLLEDLTDLDGGSGISFQVLSLLAADLPEPGAVDDLEAALAADPGLGWRLLLAHHATAAEIADVETLEAVVAGETDAVEAATSDLDRLKEPPEGVAPLLACTPSEHGARLLAAIDGLRGLWEELAGEAMNAITRDVAHRQAQLDDGLAIADIVMEATNGYELSGDPAIHRIVLLPSFWLRPWLVVGRRADAEVLTTVVAEEFLVLPPESPPPALLKLFKALGDESRLTLLRRMSTGAISLTEATNELEVAKATAHHHLSILRQAGLVSIGGKGRSSRYRLREDPPALAAEALASYLQPHRRTAANARTDAS